MDRSAGRSRRTAAVLYASRRGNTERLAEAVADALRVKAQPLGARRLELASLVFVGACPGRARRALRDLAPQLAGRRAALFCSARLFRRRTLARIRRLLPGVEVVAGRAFCPPLGGDELAEVEQAREWALRVCRAEPKPAPAKENKAMASVGTKPMQRARKAVLLLFLLLFPLVLNFLSPYLSLSGAMRGTISGSLLFFGLLLASSLLLGRAFCGWVCPGGALQEMCFAVNDRIVTGRRLDWIKYLIWAPWLGLIALGLLRAAAPCATPSAGWPRSWSWDAGPATWFAGRP